MLIQRLSGNCLSSGQGSPGPHFLHPHWINPVHRALETGLSTSNWTLSTSTTVPWFHSLPLLRPLLLLTNQPWCRAPSREDVSVAWADRFSSRALSNPAPGGPRGGANHLSDDGPTDSSITNTQRRPT
jgi:hypothetical protein